MWSGMEELEAVGQAGITWKSLFLQSLAAAMSQLREHSINSVTTHWLLPSETSTCKHLAPKLFKVSLKRFSDLRNHP